MNRAVWLVAAFTGIVGFLLGLVVMRSAAARPAVVPASTLTVVSTPAPPATFGRSADIALSADFAAVAARVNAAVVNVDAAVRGDIDARTSPRWRRDLVEDPAAPREGKGSGFIIDAAGYVLTNFHVVDGADRLTVTLSDGRAFRAEITGVDPALDVALIKIASSDSLPVAVLGNSQELRVGQWVCAIGNPLGYVHSVTVGVVSFLRRKLFDPSLDAYIQTDAAISLGNSGGPLIDAEGRVIGMTSAVSSQAANIGFAIPISQVVAILPQLRERGRVSRGYVGVGVTRVTPTLMRALKLPVDRGALVQDVTADSAAERAGVRAYDVVVAADALEIQSDDEFIRHMAARAPGTLATLHVLRGGSRHRITVKLTERPIPAGSQSKPSRDETRPAARRTQDALGLTVRDLDSAAALRRALPDAVQGVVIVEVDNAGPARLARLRPGQIVLEVNRQPTTTLVAYQTAIAAIGRGQGAAVLLYDPITDRRLLVGIVPDGQP